VKSLGIRGIGSINMRGKRTARLACNCCEMQDLRPRELAKIARDEIAEAARRDPVCQHGLGAEDHCEQCCEFCRQDLADMLAEYSAHTPDGKPTPTR
jgi:hypothetical protein